MKVHHHSHVEKKNFKEYFLEFLMIFAAKANSGTYKIDSDFIRNLGKARTDSIAFKKTFALFEYVAEFQNQFYDSKTFNEMKSTGDIRLIRSKNSI